MISKSNPNDQSIKCWFVVHPEIEYYGNQNKQITDVFNSMDKSEKCYAKLKK